MNKDEVRRKIEGKIDEADKKIAELLKVLDIVKPILKKHVGKKMTKRIVDDIKSVKPEWNVYIERVASMSYLNVQGPGVELHNNERFRFFLGYGNMLEAERLEQELNSFEKLRGCDNGKQDIDRIVELAWNAMECLGALGKYRNAASYAAMELLRAKL